MSQLWGSVAKKKKKKKLNYVTKCVMTKIEFWGKMCFLKNKQCKTKTTYYPKNNKLMMKHGGGSTVLSGFFLLAGTGALIKIE